MVHKNKLHSFRHKLFQNIWTFFYNQYDMKTMTAYFHVGTTQWTVLIALQQIEHLRILQIWKSYLPIFFNHLSTKFDHIWWTDVKFYYWAFLLFCVVLNFQYFRRYSEKNDFWPFLDIFSRAVTHSFIFRLTWFFVYRCKIF